MIRLLSPKFHTRRQDRMLALIALFRAAYLLAHVEEQTALTSQFWLPTIRSIFELEAQNVPTALGGQDSLCEAALWFLQWLRRGKVAVDRRIPANAAMSYAIGKEIFIGDTDHQMLVSTLKQSRLDLSRHYLSLQTEQELLSLHTLYLVASVFTDLVNGTSIRVDTSNLSAEEQAKTKALLFAGARAAFLYFQAGGSMPTTILELPFLFLAQKRFAKNCQKMQR